MAALREWSYQITTLTSACTPPSKQTGQTWWTGQNADNYIDHISIWLRAKTKMLICPLCRLTMTENSPFFFVQTVEYVPSFSKNGSACERTDLA